jgi:hypothetical protein
MNVYVGRAGKWSLLLLGLIASGIAISAGGLALFEYGEDNWLPPWRWVGFAVFSVFLFTSTATQYRRYWRKRRFWLCLLGLLVAHTVVYAVLLTTIPAWRNIWFLPLTIAEFLALAYVLDQVLHHRTPATKNAPDPNRWTG